MNTKTKSMTKQNYKRLEEIKNDLHKISTDKHTKGSVAMDLFNAVDCINAGIRDNNDRNMD